jgi:hypothetical protein
MAIEAPAVGQVCTTWHHKQCSAGLPCASKQLVRVYSAHLLVEGQ